LALAGTLAVEYGNEKDYIALRTAYLLDLRGPAVSLNTACSTTLLAVDHACRSLLEHECDAALAGGIDITIPQKSGFLYQEGVYSPKMATAARLTPMRPARCSAMAQASW